MDETTLRLLLNSPVNEDSAKEKHVAKLVELAGARGIKTDEVLLRLLRWVAVSGFGFKRHRGHGRGAVRHIEFDESQLVLISDDDIRYTYSSPVWGGHRRWKRFEMEFISRYQLEEELGVWPGYIDAVEELYEYLIRWYKERTAESDSKVMKELKEQFAWHERTENALRMQYATARHADLKLWRERNPISAEEVPAALRSIGHVKRLAVNEPCHVYFLLHKGEVVYVGQLTDSVARQGFEPSEGGEEGIR